MPRRRFSGHCRLCQDPKRSIQVHVALLRPQWLLRHKWSTCAFLGAKDVQECTWASKAPLLASDQRSLLPECARCALSCSNHEGQPTARTPFPFSLRAWVVYTTWLWHAFGTVMAPYALLKLVKCSWKSAESCATKQCSCQKKTI